MDGHGRGGWGGHDILCAGQCGQVVLICIVEASQNCNSVNEGVTCCKFPFEVDEGRPVDWEVSLKHVMEDIIKLVLCESNYSRRNF